MSDENNILMDGLPTEKALNELPLRAIIAYASRCAKRVQPIYLLPYGHQDKEKHFQSVQRANEIAEAFAKGEKIDCLMAHHLATEALNAAKSAQGLMTGIQAFLAANSAAEASFAVYAAATELSSNNEIAAKAYMLVSSIKPLEESLIEVRALHTANFTARAAAFSGNASPSAVLHAHDDYQKLISLNLGKYPDLGSPIDPSEDGPLGQLWPNGKPCWYAVDQNHPFYDGILQFFVSLTSLKGLLWSSMVDKKYRNGTKPTMVETSKGIVPSFVVELPDLRLETHMIEVGCDDESVFSPVATMDYLLGNAGLPLQLLFAVRPTSMSLPKKEDAKGMLDVHLGPSLEMIACYIVGAAFERYKDHFEIKYGKDPSLWSQELQFFRHLRNGCFHNNKFSIRTIRKGKIYVDQIDVLNPPRWHTYTMTSDAAMNGQKVMDGFFKLIHLLPFLYDMGEFV